jgi:serine/threonine-protein kinase
MTPAAPLWQRAMPWSVAVLAVAGAVGIGVPKGRVSPPAPLRMSIALPDGHRITSGPIISRDGRRIVFASGSGAAQPKLYLRTFDSFDLKELAGTEGADRPFFSPDGRSIGFFARTKLFKLDLEGGAPAPLAAAPNAGGGTWAEDGTIVFVPTWNGGLYRIDASGGTPTLLIRPDPAKKEYAYTSPLFLPDGKELLFSVWGASFDIARMTLADLERDIVAPGLWTSAVYATSGHILAGNNQGDIEAVPYPTSGGAATVSVLGNVHWSGGEGDGVVKFAVSDGGTLVYAPGDITQRSLVIVDETGRAAAVPAKHEMYLGVNLSPDGRQAAVGQSERIWVVDLERGTRTPVAEQRGGAQSRPIWSPDGKRIVFASNVEGNWEIYAVNPAQPSVIDSVLRKESDQYPASAASDGALLFDETRPGYGRDIWILSPDGTAKAWLATQVNEGFAAFSPDGQFIAYQSDASGRDEVYVQSRDGRSARVQVSTGGGEGAAWAPSGDRIFYREGNAMMAVDLRVRPSLSAGPPRRLFDGGWALPAGAPFAVMPGGKRFLMVRFAPAAIPTRLDVIFNWFVELRKRAPLK